MNASAIRLRLAAASCDIVIPSSRATSRTPSSGRPASSSVRTRFAASRSLLGEGGGVVVGERHAERAPCALEELAVEPGALGDLGRGQLLAAAAEDALDRQQREPVLVDRGAQLVELDAVVGELCEQLQPRLARLALEALEQALGLEIDLAHREPILPAS